MERLIDLHQFLAHPRFKVHVEHLEQALEQQWPAEEVVTKDGANSSPCLSGGLTSAVGAVVGRGCKMLPLQHCGAPLPPLPRIFNFVLV
jgi:hypothetical protein